MTTTVRPVFIDVLLSQPARRSAGVHAVAAAEGAAPILGGIGADFLPYPSDARHFRGINLLWGGMLLFATWTHHATNGMIRTVPDLDDLRVFEKVGSLRSFAAAAKALSQPRSNVSRSVARLEASLGTRLIHRTTREVTLTPAGESLMARSSAALGQLGEALGYVGSLATEAHGQLRVSAGIGFGINVLSEQLPAFLRSHPKVDIVLDLTSRMADLVADRVDVAIRFGPLPDSSMVAVRLGEMKRAVCAAPAYLERVGQPRTLDDLAAHDVIEMPDPEGRARTWSFVKDGRTSELVVEPRLFVNDALTIHRLVLNGAGIGILSCYLCAPDIEAGRLVQLLPEWSAPAVPVSMLFPSRRELAPVVRAFVDYMKEANPPGSHWQNNELPTKAEALNRVTNGLTEPTPP